MSPERSAEERERARLEREARRTAREGRTSMQPRPVPVRETRPEPPEPPRQQTPPPVPPQPPPAPPKRPDPPMRRTPRSAAERRAAAKEFLGGRGKHGSRLSRGLIAALLAGLALTIGVWFLLSLFQPFKGDGSGEVAVTIPRGAGVGEIGDLLEDEGVISSASFFRIRATLAGKSGDFKAGEIPMRHGMSYGAAIDLLADPPVPDTVTITIPEGLSRSEIADVVGGSLRGSYASASRRSRVLDPADYGGRSAKTLEGFLFPATYELKPHRPVQELVDRQLIAWKRELAGVDMAFAKRKNLNVYDVLTIASMVEREAQVAGERKLVASVIYNRLNQGIPLGIDATIRFATGNWSEPLKQSELAIDSGYNTRLHQGLPPGPIGNPGRASIEAAAHPASTDFLYYVVKPGSCGEHSFSATDAKFQQDVERYNSERAARGGKSPTDC